MNITGILLSHWYRGCALIGKMFFDGVVAHANIMQGKPYEPISLEQLCDEVWVVGTSVANVAEARTTQSVTDAVVTKYHEKQQAESQKTAEAAAAEAVLELLPIPAQGS